MFFHVLVDCTLAIFGLYYLRASDVSIVDVDYFKIHKIPDQMIFEVFSSLTSFFANLPC